MHMISDSVDDHELLLFVGDDAGNVLIEFRSPGWIHEVRSVLYDTDHVDVELGVSVGHVGTDVSEISPLWGWARFMIAALLAIWRPFGAKRWVMLSGGSKISPLRGLTGMRIAGVLSTFRPYGAMR